MIWIGTSGFQYPEWKGSFYPEKLSAAKMLPYYAEHFSTTEINYSFYRIPSAKTLEGWCAATPPSFRFSFKASKQITHVLQLKNAHDALRRFLAAVEMVNEKLGAILFQLPPGFKKDLPTLDQFLDELPPHIPCAFEFRHRSWFGDDVFDRLHAGNIALCIAESERLKTPRVFTADFGYLRLRDEGYEERDLHEWAEVVAERDEHLQDIYVYFKHEERGLGPQFADTMKNALQLQPQRVG